VERGLFCWIGDLKFADIRGPDPASRRGSIFLAADYRRGGNGIPTVWLGFGGPMNPNLTPFLLGVLAAASATAALFFLKFWKKTNDSIFLAFAAYFLIEAVNRVALVFMERPNEGIALIYGARLFATLLIIAAILRKNYGKGGGSA
jgi:hypothetical protein